jgi:hypothetical protein
MNRLVNYAFGLNYMTHRAVIGGVTGACVFKYRDKNVTYIDSVIIGMGTGVIAAGSFTAVPVILTVSLLQLLFDVKN